MERQSLANIIEQIRGVSYKPEDVRNNCEGAVALLRANNIKDGIINFDDVIYVDKKRVSPKQLLKKGDVLICASSGSKSLVGKAALINFDGEYTFGAFMKVVRPKNVDSDFLGMYFQSDIYRRTIAELSAGANINNIRNEDIDGLLLPIYDNNTQKNIANILKSLKTLISNRKKQLELLDQLVKSRFVEMFGDLKTSPKYSGIKLKEICRTLSGGTPTTKHPEYYEGNIPWITTVQLGPNYIDGSNPKAFITQEAIDNSATHLIPANNILFGTRVGVGKCSINIEKMCTNQDINAIINIDIQKWNLLFIKQVLDNYLPYFDSIKKGATILGITTDDLKSVEIPNIEKSIQDEFAAFIEQIDKSKQSIQQNIEQLEILEKSLMQKYFG